MTSDEHDEGEEEAGRWCPYRVRYEVVTFLLSAGILMYTVPVALEDGSVTLSSGVVRTLAVLAAISFGAQMVNLGLEAVLSARKVREETGKPDEWSDWDEEVHRREP